jgi:hypothetical protein
MTSGTYVTPPTTSLNGQLISSTASYTTPSLGLPSQQYQGGRGICTLSYGGKTLQFRTNPNEITWDYQLITHVEETYGGRVVQILGCKMDNLTVKVDCGQGGLPYLMYVAGFMRDLMVTQRNGVPAVFTYTTRNWILNVFALDVPFQDSVTETVRELELKFKIQEDVAGTQTSASLSAALSALQDGIGLMASGFGTSAINSSTLNNANGGGLAQNLQSTPTSTAATAATGPTSLGIPGLSDVTSFLGFSIPGL